jgi:hypothetical protein
MKIDSLSGGISERWQTSISGQIEMRILRDFRSDDGDSNSKRSYSETLFERSGGFKIMLPREKRPFGPAEEVEEAVCLRSIPRHFF